MRPHRRCRTTRRARIKCACICAAILSVAMWITSTQFDIFILQDNRELAARANWPRDYGPLDYSGKNAGSWWMGIRDGLFYVMWRPLDHNGQYRLMAKRTPFEPDWTALPSLRRAWGAGALKVPLWFPVPLALIALWALKREEKRRALKSSECRCMKCGYSLVGNVSGVCPECGAPVPADAKTLGI
jgi:hypothetical protein